MRLKEIIRNPIFFLFLFFYFYFLLVFDSTIYYHFHQPIFLFDRSFFKEFLLFPGGLIEWITLFVIQFLYFDWLGSFIITAIFLTIYAIVNRLIGKLVNVESSFILAFLPISLLLVLQNNYSFSLIIPVKYLVSLCFFLVYKEIYHRYKILFILLLSGLIYFIIGGWFFFFYISLCIIHEVIFSRNKKRYFHIGFNIGIFLLYPYIAARYLFVIPLSEAYFYIAPYELYHEPFLFKPTSCLYMFFLSLPVLIATIFIYLTFIKYKLRQRNRSLSRVHALLIILLLGSLVLKLSFKQEQKIEIQVDLLAEQGKWQELLTLSRKVNKYNRRVNFNINRALYHTGQLLENLFSHFQLLGTDGLFIHRIMSSQTAIPASDLYFDLGHVNASEVMAFEGQTKLKYNPRILKRLVQTNIINREFAAAGKFVALLKKSILHRKWVNLYENYLSNISLIKDDSLIQSKRKLRPQTGFFIDKKRPEHDLIRLLEEDNSNMMAFEYLMAYYLLECKTGHVVKYLSKFKDLGYRKLPRHIEEALLLIRVMSPPDSGFNFDELKISHYTINQFTRFNRTLFQNRENEARAKSLLKKEFGDTYWYYVRFLDPKITKVMLKEKRVDEN